MSPNIKSYNHADTGVQTNRLTDSNDNWDSIKDILCVHIQNHHNNSGGNTENGANNISSFSSILLIETLEGAWGDSGGNINDQGNNSEFNRDTVIKSIFSFSNSKNILKVENQQRLEKDF